MLYVKFKDTFRERASEWALSLTILGYGLITFSEKGTFVGKPFFAPLLRLMDQEHWAWTLITIGLIRFIFLVVNGAWRPSAHIRALGCAMGAMVWGSFFVSAFGLDYVTPTLCIYGMLVGLDLLSLWFAAGDAKMADSYAKRHIATGA